MPAPTRVRYMAGMTGPWRIDSVRTVTGPGLPEAAKLSVLEGSESKTAPSNQWTLTGATSNTRYTERPEVDKLVSKQASLARTEATCAALIPIRKNARWWDLAQDERRAVFEEQSHHIQIGLDYLPEVARRLHHSRDLGEPFDFLTWFEFAPEHATAFEHMVERLRKTPEWRYVDREVDIRLSR